MGREVRRVPADWQHPKDWRWDHCGNRVERYKPLFQGDEYQPRASERTPGYASGDENE